MNHLSTVASTVMLALSVSPMSAVAAPSSEVAFDLETIHLLRTADVARGEELVKEYKCSKCHGDAGISEDPEEVNLAGQLDSYLYKQLQDYHHGKRLNRSMQRACKNITDQDMANIASWYASLDGAKQAETQPNENTLKLVYQGDPTRLLKSCRSCHGRKGEGGQFQHPAIAGQNRDYFIETMTAFKEGDRENDVYSRMRIIAEQLTTEEIEALATFYAAYITPDPDQ